MNKLCIKLIKFYQNKISPNTYHRCRYFPSCSQYGLECFQKFCFTKAFFLTLFRILRCNPLFKGGWDPSPMSKIEKQIDRFFKKIG